MLSTAKNKGGMRFFRRVVTLSSVALLVQGCASSPTGRMRDAHLLYSRDPALRTITAVETGGPFYERVETAAGGVRASYRPFLHTRITMAEDEAERNEVLWPIYGSNRRGDALSWRFLLCFGDDKDRTDPDSASRLWAFPFWFHGRTKAGKDYAAFFPVRGTIRDMYWERIYFTLFPLWVEYDRVGFETKSVLWPIFSRTTGESGYGFKVFPVYGEITRRGKSKSAFVLWPFWTSAHYVDRNPGREWMLFPVTGRVDRESESAWMALPPFFTFSHGRGQLEKYRKINCPWPIVRIVDRDDYHQRIFWPFWGRSYRDDDTFDSRWVLWPFFRSRFAERGGFQERSDSVFPVFHRSTVSSRTERGGAYDHGKTDFLRVWPLYTRRAEPGNAFVRIPDLTLSKRANALDRNFLGMFTLYTRGETEEPKQIDREALWGMFRFDRGESRTVSRVWPFYDSREDDSGWCWSTLGGLIGREGCGETSAWRYLWFFGGVDADSASGEEER